MNMRVILVSDYERAKLVMNARPKKLIPPSEYTAKVAGSADGLFDSYGHQWSRLRRATAPSFSNQSIASHCSVVAERVYIFTKRLAQSCCSSKGSIVPIVALNNSAMVLTMEVITQVAFGFSVDDPVNTYFLAPDFLSDILNIADFVVAYLLFPLPYWLWRYLPQYWLEKKAHKASMRMRSEVLRIINHRRELLAARSAESVSSCPKQQHPAVMDQLLARQQDTTGAHLTEEEVISNIKTIYLAGGFSTSSSISWVGFILATKPEVVTKLRAEIENTLLRGQPSETTSLQSVLSSFWITLRNLPIVRPSSMKSFVFIPPPPSSSIRYHQESNCRLHPNSLLIQEIRSGSILKPSCAILRSSLNPCPSNLSAGYCLPRPLSKRSSVCRPWKRLY